MGICKPYLYEAADKAAPPKLSPRECMAECPYGRDLLAVLPRQPSEIPKQEFASATGSKPFNNYKTSTERALVYKPDIPFMVNISAHPTRPMTAYNSTMRDTYPPHSTYGTNGIIVPTIRDITESKLNRVGLDCEPPFTYEGGDITEMDYMVPTTAKHYRRFRPDELQTDAPLTIYTETGAYKPKGGLAPTMGECRPAPGPIWDQVKMHKRVPNTYVPHRLPIVPHRGMCSEKQEKFQHRTDTFYVHSLFPSVKFPITLYPYRGEEIFLCPGMYVPESAHYGSRIPVSTFVATHKTKTDHNIPFCTMKKKSSLKTRTK